VLPHTTTVHQNTKTQSQPKTNLNRLDCEAQAERLWTQHQKQENKLKFRLDFQNRYLFSNFRMVARSLARIQKKTEFGFGGRWAFV
jgi:hypothetical protein